MQRRLLAVLGPLFIIGGGIGSLVVHRARREREAAQLVAEQERNRERERERAELEAKVAAMERELQGESRHHHPLLPAESEERKRIRVDASLQAAWDARHPPDGASAGGRVDQRGGAPGHGPE